MTTEKHGSTKSQLDIATNRWGGHSCPAGEAATGQRCCHVWRCDWSANVLDIGQNNIDANAKMQVFIVERYTVRRWTAFTRYLSVVIMLADRCGRLIQHHRFNLPLIYDIFVTSFLAPATHTAAGGSFISLWISLPSELLNWTMWNVFRQTIKKCVHLCVLGWLGSLSVSQGGLKTLSLNSKQPKLHSISF